MSTLDAGDRDPSREDAATATKAGVSPAYASPGYAGPGSQPGPVAASQAEASSASALEGSFGLRDAIFDKLVTDENDVVGLLAYSLSMQNKRDWLAAFQLEKGRDPQAGEMAAYDIGERIERRLATYRKLAENALAGNSFWASSSLTPVSELPGAPSSGAYPGSQSAAPATAAPAGSGPPRKVHLFGDSAGRLALAGGVFILLVAAALAARHIMGV
jgi:hypothetical protein